MKKYVSNTQLVIHMFSSFAIPQRCLNQDSYCPMSQMKFRYNLDSFVSDGPSIPQNVITSELRLVKSMNEQKINNISMIIFRDISKDSMMGIINFMNS